MDGIVSLLDEAHDTLVRDIWVDLQREFGLDCSSTSRYPHLSYHVAESYDDSRLEAALPRVLRGVAPFKVNTTGLGIFSGEQLVLFIPVVRTAELSKLHAALWEAAGPTATRLVDVYGPATWMPHITLAYNVDKVMLPKMVGYLGGRNFDWSFLIDSLFVVTGAGSDEERQMRFPFLAA